MGLVFRLPWYSLLQPLSESVASDFVKKSFEKGTLFDAQSVQLIQLSIERHQSENVAFDF